MTPRTILATGPVGRLLAAGILCVLLASLYLMVVAPLLDLYASRTAVLADRRMLAARQHAIAAEVPGLQARVAELRSAASARQITLDGASDAIAAANLQSRLGELATAAGVTIGSSEGLTAESRDGYRRIGLRLAISGDFKAIVQLLAAIETAAPPLVSSNLRLRGTVRPAGDSSGGRLDGGFEVYGFRLADASVADPR
jgi:general secretion pathway protein M